jgi:ATP-dependent DNA ligase
VGREGKASAGSVPRYTPMVPTQVRGPFHRDGRVYEEKIDGWPILAYKDGDRVRLLSRNGIDHARRFREVVAAVRGALGVNPRARW